MKKNYTFNLVTFNMSQFVGLTLAMISAYNLLCCPLCKSAVNEELKCLLYGEQYTLREGVYVMINPKLSVEERKWGESIFSQEQEEEEFQRYGSFINGSFRLTTADDMSTFYKKYGIN